MSTDRGEDLELEFQKEQQSERSGAKTGWRSVGEAFAARDSVGLWAKPYSTLAWAG